MRKRAFLPLAALLGLSAVVAQGTEPVAPDYTPAIDRAIAADRLIQAEAMLGRKDIVLPGPDRARLAASLLLAQRRDAEAFTRFEALLATQPDDCRLQAGAGIAALRLGRVGDAGPRLRAATAACADDAKAWGGLAMLEDKAANWDRSADAYGQAIALTPDDPALLNNAGVSLLAQRRYADAARTFRQALLLDPANERAKNNLDIARVANGERPSFNAEDDSQRRAERLNNAGYMALLTGDEGAATRYFAEAIKVNPFEFRTAEANLGDVSGAAGATP